MEDTLSAMVTGRAAAGRRAAKLALDAVVLLLALWLLWPGLAAAAVNTAPPVKPVRLVFIHHSTGEAWLADGHGRLGIALRNNNYFVSDTNYDWGSELPPSRGEPIGSTTDIGDWYTWFRGPDASSYMSALYAESGRHCSYSRLARKPAGPNQIVLFKSCFPNSDLLGSRTASPPPIASNPLKGQACGGADFTVANAKGIYLALLPYFAAHQEKLFVAIVAPPIQSPSIPANGRAMANWLVDHWLDGYPYHNVAVFDFYNVLTSKTGGGVSDVGLATGNHHRVWHGAVQHKTDDGVNHLMYPSGGDDHPNAAGDRKATAEFLPLLNNAYNTWQAASHTITITAPTAASSWPSGSRQSVTWTMDPAVSTGEFRVGLVSAAGKRYINKKVLPVAGRTAYSTALVAAVPAAAAYKAYVYWRPAVGAGTWTAKARSAAFAVSSAGVTYYVSPSGDDAASGSRDHPWRSPGAASKRIGGGDTLVILGGRYVLRTYWDDMITPPSGTGATPTRIVGEGTHRPVLAGRDDLFSAIDLSGTSYVTIENLEITSDGGAPFRGGVEASGAPVDHLVLRDLFVHHIDGEGLNIGDVDHLLVEDCRFAYCATGAIAGPDAQHGGNRHVVIRDCYLGYSGHYYQGGPGPGPYDRPDGFGIEASKGPIEIAGCTVEHNLGDGLDSKAALTRIHDCVVANNTCDGVKMWAGGRLENTLIYGMGDGVGGPSPWAGIVLTGAAGTHFQIVNVTLHDNSARHAYPIYVQYDSTVPLSVLIRNTTISGGYGAVYLGDAVTLTADHDDFYRPGEHVQVHADGRDFTTSQLRGGSLGAGIISADPRFTAPAWGTPGDYHLTAGSPLIDAGTALGAPALDLDGLRRPAGTAEDIGAYEYGAAAAMLAHIQSKRQALGI